MLIFTDVEGCNGVSSGGYLLSQSPLTKRYRPTVYVIICVLLSAQSLCRSDVDVVFMVDSSRSISSSDFNEAKKFVKQAAEEFGVAPGQSRAAVILFGESAKAMIGFVDAPTLEGFQKAVDGLKHLLGGHTRIDQALITAAKLFSNSKKKKVALLLTDGQQSRGFPDLKTASERLRNASVRVIAVGIGDKVDEPELKSITESEDDVILTKDYQDLKDKLLSIISRACDESKSNLYITSSYSEAINM